MSIGSVAEGTKKIKEMNVYSDNPIKSRRDVTQRGPRSSLTAHTHLTSSQYLHPSEGRVNISPHFPACRRPARPGGRAACLRRRSSQDAQTTCLPPSSTSARRRHLLRPSSSTGRALCRRQPRGRSGGPCAGSSPSRDTRRPSCSGLIQGGTCLHRPGDTERRNVAIEGHAASLGGSECERKSSIVAQQEAVCVCGREHAVHIHDNLI